MSPETVPDVNERSSVSSSSQLALRLESRANAGPSHPATNMGPDADAMLHTRPPSAIRGTKESLTRFAP